MPCPSSGGSLPWQHAWLPLAQSAGGPCPLQEKGKKKDGKQPAASEKGDKGQGKEKQAAAGPAEKGGSGGKKGRSGGGGSGSKKARVQQ